MKPHAVTLGCKFTDINWECLPELSTRLRKHSMNVSGFSANLDTYPVFTEFKDVSGVVEYVRAKGSPDFFNIRFLDKDNALSLTVHKLVNLHQQRVVLLSVEGFGDENMVREIAAFLGLEPDAKNEAPKEIARTAFIAHRFDVKGTEDAEKLARFLALLGFAVKTGRAFAPKSVSEKVKERIETQHVIFVILTPGEQKAWLIQESVLHCEHKPLFILKQNDASFEPGILADHEFIPFGDGHFEVVYQPILEGLKELDLLHFS